MNPRDTQEQIGLFPLPAAPSAAELDTIRAQALAARDAAVAAILRRAVLGFGRGLLAVGQALTSWPQRRAVYENLRTLTDRELADIGLARGDIARVFEPGFRVPAQRPNPALATARAQAA